MKKEWVDTPARKAARERNFCVRTLRGIHALGFSLTKYSPQIEEEIKAMQEIVDKALAKLNAPATKEHRKTFWKKWYVKHGYDEDGRFRKDES